MHLDVIIMKLDVNCCVMTMHIKCFTFHEISFIGCLVMMQLADFKATEGHY